MNKTFYYIAQFSAVLFYLFPILLSGVQWHPLVNIITGRMKFALLLLGKNKMNGNHSIYNTYWGK